jgi:hypothetical protein
MASRPGLWVYGSAGSGHCCRRAVTPTDEPLAGRRLTRGPKASALRTSSSMLGSSFWGATTRRFPGAEGSTSPAPAAVRRRRPGWRRQRGAADGAGWRAAGSTIGMLHAAVCSDACLRGSAPGLWAAKRLVEMHAAAMAPAKPQGRDNDV